MIRHGNVNITLKHENIVFEDVFLEEQILLLEYVCYFLMRFFSKLASFIDSFTEEFFKHIVFSY